MATTLPVSITFRLPEGWRPAPPDDVGAPGAAFVALHPAPEQGFTANITISGEERFDDTPLTAIAQASVDRLRGTVAEVEVADRKQVGSEEAPGMTQLLRLRSVAEGVERSLVQAQVYLSFNDANQPSRRAVIDLVLTATAAQFESVVGDFQEFVRTVAPAQPGDRDGQDDGERPA